MFCLIVSLVPRALFVFFFIVSLVPHALFVLFDCTLVPRALFARSVLFDCDVSVSCAFRRVSDVSLYLALSVSFDFNVSTSHAVLCLIVILMPCTSFVVFARCLFCVGMKCASDSYPD